MSHAGRLALRSALLCTLVLPGALSGCTGLPDSGEKGYVTGDGLVRQIAPAERTEPIDLTGDDLDGGTVAVDTPVSPASWSCGGPGVSSAARSRTR